MTFEIDPHPLLDLSPMEQVILLKTERDEMRPGCAMMTQYGAINRLRDLELIEFQDGAWIPTTGRGQLVARVLERFEHARTTRRSPSALEKKTAVLEGVERTLGELVAEVRALPFPSLKGSEG